MIVLSIAKDILIFEKDKATWYKDKTEISIVDKGQNHINKGN